jgi:uncharacterized membrane protein YhaH (DUF805 family)
MEWMLKPLVRYADFSGRSRRKEFWMYQLLNFLVICFVVLIIIAGSAATSEGEFGPLAIVGFVLLILWVLGTFIPNLAVQIRRFHDQDKSGWFVCLGLIPYLGGLIIFVFMLLEGTVGDNRFGPDPKDRTGGLGLSV